MKAAAKKASTYWRAAEGVNIGFSQESSGYVIYIPSMKQTIVNNHVRFDESCFPNFSVPEAIDSAMNVKGRLENQLRWESPVTWEAYDQTWQ